VPVPGTPVAGNSTPGTTTPGPTVPGPTAITVGPIPPAAGPAAGGVPLVTAFVPVVAVIDTGRVVTAVNPIPTADVGRVYGSPTVVNDPGPRVVAGPADVRLAAEAKAP